MREIIRTLWVAIAALVIVSSFGCTYPVTMKVRSLGTLDSDDYKEMEVIANQSPVKLGKAVGDNCEPTMVYYVVNGYDFSRVKSIYIPDFKSLDQKADERVTKNTADEVGALLLKKKLFERVERATPADADIELDAVVVRYQKITGTQTATSMFTGTPHCGLCLMEIKLIDSKSKTKIAAIQINHLTARARRSDRVL